MNYIHTRSDDYKTELVNLYNECFSTGLSAQHIDTDELDAYIRRILAQGYAYLAEEGGEVLGALLCLPLTYDEHLPEAMRAKVKVENTLYIAELMVAEKARGQGLGKRLLAECLAGIDRSLFFDVVIRVWEENKPALGLYMNAGFESLDTLVQMKMKPGGHDIFEMKKIYLRKNIVDIYVQFDNKNN